MASPGGSFPGVMSFLVGLLSFGLIDVQFAGSLGAVGHAARVRLGGVNVLSGAGAPSGDPGAHPVVYLRSDPVSAATVVYLCHTGSTWSAVTP